MKALLHVDFFGRPGEGSQGCARLEVDLPFTPTPDIGIEHPVWHNPRKPNSISYNIEDERFYVYLGYDRLESKVHRDQNAEMYRVHGWDVSD
jgi:hypothetical protein